MFSFNKEENTNKLSISNLLNDVSIDPMQHPLAPNTTTAVKSDQPHDYFNNINYSPISSGASSPSDISNCSSRQSSIHNVELPDLWNHSRTGMHQTTTGDIIVSSLAKAKRKRILPYQYARLMETFENTDTPSSEIRGQLANDLDMTKREVQVWFQNRRAKMTRNKSSSRQSSIKSMDEIPRRRTLEYSTPYGNIVPKRSTSVIDQPTNNKHVTPSISDKMILEAPYHPATKDQNSAIDLLASAAEMVRQN